VSDRKEIVSTDLTPHHRLRFLFVLAPLGTKEIIMNRFVSLVFALVLVAFGTVMNGSSSAAAPPAPQPVTLPCATDMSVQMLGNAQPAAAADQSLVLVRAIFGPGGGIGPHTHPGTLVISVESGEFGFTPGGEGAMEMTVMRSGEAGTPAAAEPMRAGQETVLYPGDWVVETGMVHSARTVGDEPAVVVFSGLVAAGQPLTTCV
jgi:quercetin dioxygenase-like cupin family protein